MTQATMTHAKLRPSFSVILPMAANQAAQQIRRNIAQMPWSHLTRSAGMVTELFIEPSECRYWSPHLSTQLHQLEGDRCELFARFSPRPEVWTLVMFVYALAVCSMFAGSVWGYVQWTLGWSPWALTIIPAAAVLIGGLHGVSLVGQSWSKDQIELLYQRLNEILEPLSPEQSE